MEFFRTNTQIPFMGQRKVAAWFSIFIFVGSIAALLLNGLNFGLDFTGGNQLQATFNHTVDVSQLRQSLTQQGFPEAQVTTSGSKQVIVRVGPHKGTKPEVLAQRLVSIMPAGIVSSSAQYIGPSVGKELWSHGLLAILLSLIFTMLYIAIRFEYRFALSAAVALIHDPLLIFGLFALLHIEFNMIVLTAVLTVLGYSLNDTIVVYDRVRENFRKIRKKSPSDIMDLSINQTLSRTIMTSGLTLLVVIALFVWGGHEVHGFALALMIGIVIGTYSSIYVAGSLSIALGLTPQNLITQSKKFDDGRP